MSKPNPKVEQLLAAHTPQEIEALYRAAHRDTRWLAILILLVSTPTMVWVERWRLATADHQEPTALMMAAMIALLFAVAAFVVRLHRHDGPIEEAYSRCRAK